MRAVTWRGFQGWRSDDGDATLDVVPGDPADPAVEELLSALDAEARPHELEGLTEPLTAYRAAFAGRRSLVPATARRGLVLTGLLGAKAAAAAGGVALGLAATAMAVAVNLPDTTADRTPESPAAAGTSAARPTADGTAVGPDTTGAAAYGLCTAWSSHQKNGDTAAMDSVPMRNLAEAAGGEGKIAAYCAAVPQPGNGPKDPKPGKAKATPGQSQRDKDRDTGKDDDNVPGTTRKPTTKPTAKPTTKPTAKATTKATAKPKASSSSSRTAPAPKTAAPAGTPTSKGP